MISVYEFVHVSKSVLLKQNGEKDEAMRWVQDVEQL